MQLHRLGQPVKLADEDELPSLLDLQGSRSLKSHMLHLLSHPHQWTHNKLGLFSIIGVLLLVLHLLAENAATSVYSSSEANRSFAEDMQSMPVVFVTSHNDEMQAAPFVRYVYTVYRYGLYDTVERPELILYTFALRK